MTPPVRVLTATEPWAEYQLEDGTLLRFRFTACSFRKTGKMTAEGDPEYAFSQQVQCETHAPQQVASIIALRQPDEAEMKRMLARARASGCFDQIDTAPSEYCAPAEDCG